MKKNLLVTISLVSILALPGAQLFAQVSKSSTHPVTTPAMSEAQSIEHVLKALFEKPEAPLKVSPVSIEGEYAVAGWLQDQRGGRALLKKEMSKWSILVCGGDGLTQASVLTMTGMPGSTARRLETKVIAAEKDLPVDQVRKFGLFDGIVKVDGGAQDPHAGHGSSTHSK